MATTLREKLASLPIVRRKKIKAKAHQMIAEEMSFMLGLRLEETSVYQEANADGELEETRSLILRLLGRRVGDISPDLQAQIQDLSLSQVETLAW